jgi:hypothetical protein
MMSESNEKPLIESVDSTPENEQRREVLRSLGKWSGASVLAAVGAVAWISTAGSAKAGWLNRHGGGGGWVNRGGGGWVNRRGGGGWINRR